MKSSFPLTHSSSLNLNLTFHNTEGSETQVQYQTQVALLADLRRCCYYVSGINDSCARHKSKMGWSEVATLLIGVVWA